VAYVRHLHFSLDRIGPTEAQLALTVLKALGRIQILTLTNLPQIETLSIPDDIALSVLDIIRSPGLKRLHIYNLPMWILRGVGVGLKSLQVQYDHHSNVERPDGLRIE